MIIILFLQILVLTYINYLKNSILSFMLIFAAKIILKLHGDSNPKFTKFA
jgi:hypothetical protein